MDQVDRSRLDLASGRLTPLVGRELELATLVDRFERAAEGEGQNVPVLGEAGVGKSRLAWQLRERLSALPHTWLESRATPYTERTPFFPVIELLSAGSSLRSRAGRGAPRERESPSSRCCFGHRPGSRG